MYQTMIGNSFQTSPILRPLPMAPMVPPSNLNVGAFNGSLVGFPTAPLMPNFGSLSSINSNFLGVQDPSMLGGTNSANPASIMAFLNQMIQMMSMVMATSSGLGNAFGGSPMAALNGGSGGNMVSSGAGQPSNGNSAAPPVGSSAPTSGTSNSPVSIGPGTKVLEIGDSHSVGTFGKELDAKLRGTGAQVATYASAGATASTFTQGKSTKYGYWEKGANGAERTVGYGKSAQTPRLDQLIAKEKPSVILVNLGANFRQGDPKSQVDEIGRVAQKHGIPIIWVGPPKTAKDGSNASSLQQFDQKMASAVAPYGKYISSARHTPKYSGGDGIHYSGSQGNQIARQWADGIFREVTG